MIKFKEKQFGLGKNTVEAISKDPTKLAALGISAAALGVSTANAATNIHRRKADKKYQEKQLDAMNRLTDSLERVDKSLDHIPSYQFIEKQPRKKKGILGFFQKNNSKTVDYAVRGAVIGTGIGNLGTILAPNRIGGNIELEKYKDKDDNGKIKIREKFTPNPVQTEFQKKYNNLNFSKNPVLKHTIMSAAGALIGAGLGAIAGMIADSADKADKHYTVNNRLMKDIQDNLKKIGFKEGKDYTRDPKIAELLKTKVTLVVSRSAYTLNLIINTVNDPKLKDLTDSTIKNLPSMSVTNEKINGRFNEVNISTISNNNGDSVFISCIAEKFIRSGYPVYLIEVG